MVPFFRMQLSSVILLCDDQINNECLVKQNHEAKWGPDIRKLNCVFFVGSNTRWIKSNSLFFSEDTHKVIPQMSLWVMLSLHAVTRKWTLRMTTSDGIPLKNYNMLNNSASRQNPSLWHNLGPRPDFNFPNSLPIFFLSCTRIRMQGNVWYK